MYRYPYAGLAPAKNQVSVQVENAMVDGTATGALQVPSLASAVAWAQ